MPRRHSPDTFHAVWRAVVTRDDGFVTHLGPYTKQSQARASATNERRSYAWQARRHFNVTIQKSELLWEDVETYSQPRSSQYRPDASDGTPMTDKREYSRDQPVALDDRDPGNTDPQDLTAPLDPDDNVFAMVSQEQGDLRETSPVQEPTYGD